VKTTHRNKFEKAIGEVLEGAGFVYEPFKVPYPMLSSYTPDWALGDICVEAKGYFRAGDTKKYKAIHEALRAGGKELVFILQTPLKKVRKGSAITMAGWCNKHEIRWFLEPNDLLMYALESYDVK
jgi:hypothetical protein